MIDHPVERYKFRLAERLSMTYRQLNEAMTLQELYLWIGNDTLEADDAMHRNAAQGRR